MTYTSRRWRCNYNFHSVLILGLEPLREDTKNCARISLNMDFPYKPNPNDWHEVKLLEELQDLSLVRLTQPRWFKREVSEVSASNRHSRNRRKVDKFSQKRFNVLGDIKGIEENGEVAELSDVDDINLSDIDESQVEKALGSNDVEKWNQQQIQAKETKTKLMEILSKGKADNTKELEVQEKQTQKNSSLERNFLTEEERIKEESRLQKERNEQFFKNIIDKNYEEVQNNIRDGGAEIEYMNEYGLSCLHICCSNGDFKMLEILLKEFKERGLDINFSKKGYVCKSLYFLICLKSILPLTRCISDTRSTRMR